ncbi:MAG TPA: PEP-CTERM sorting domain-containing protein [Rhodanobacter sp.]|nr:PEP-CTERM sorting domain-containing protein [Rhodanobacter sp.]
MSKFSTRCWKRLVPLGLAASVAAVMLVPAPAEATPYIVKLVQQGNNVVATGSGTFDLAGLTLVGATVTGPAALQPSDGYVMTGPLSNVAIDSYTGYVGPTSFGSGNNFISSDVGTGDTVGIFGSSTYYGYPNFWVPSGYVSGGALSGTSTYDNASFTTLGVTPGTYVWTWGGGADQSFTLDIVTAGVPEPAALGMFGLGVLLIGAFVGLRRRTA